MGKMIYCNSCKEEYPLSPWHVLCPGLKYKPYKGFANIMPIGIFEADRYSIRFFYFQYLMEVYYY